MLRFFGTDSDDYNLVYTANASAALKTVGEYFPFTKESTYIYTHGNHNSVLGIREYAKQRGAKVRAVRAPRGSSQPDLPIVRTLG